MKRFAQQRRPEVMGLRMWTDMLGKPQTNPVVTTWASYCHIAFSTVLECFGQAKYLDLFLTGKFTAHARLLKTHYFNLLTNTKNIQNGLGFILNPQYFT